MNAIVFIILALLAVFAVFAFLYELSLFSLPPFVPAPKASLGAIVQALELRDGMCVFDLGCGDGRVLEAVRAAIPGVRIVGVERNLLPIWLARIRLGRGAELRRENFFATSLAEADRVYLYCWPTVLEKLAPKFERELKPGTRLVSADFALKTRPPTRVVDVSGPHKRVRRLYVYDY